MTAILLPLDLAAYFGAGGDGNDLTLYFQTLSGAVSFSVAAQLGNVGDNWAQFTLPADAQTLLDGIASGARFIFKAARPATVSADHAVDAGDAAFAFAVPQPSATHTLASGTVDHSVGAGDIAFTFALTQPTRTHIQAVADDHAVNAGDLNWGFDVPRPTVTHTTVVTQAHAVNAGALSFSFAVTEPRVTGGFTVDIGGMVTAYIGGNIHPIETASLHITRRVAERPIAECDVFFRNLNTFRRPRRGEQLQIHESAVPLALSATDDFPVLGFGGEAVLSLGGEAVLSLAGHRTLDTTIPTTLLFGGTVLDSKILLTNNDRIGRCVVTGTGYAALLDLTIKGALRNRTRRHLRRCDTGSVDDLCRWARAHLLCHFRHRQRHLPRSDFRLSVPQPGAHACCRCRERGVVRR